MFTNRMKRKWENLIEDLNQLGNKDAVEEAKICFWLTSRILTVITGLFIITVAIFSKM